MDGLETQRVLITGATGFVGGAIARCFAAKGFIVRLAVRRDAPAPDLAMDLAAMERVVIGDLAGRVDWTAALDGVGVVAHAAGVAHWQGDGSDQALYRINADATGALAEAARRAGARLVFVSSVRAVAGAWSDDIVTDATRPAPTDAYGRSKLAGEDAALASGAAVTILRPGPVCGAGAKGYFALMARLARTPLPLPIAGFRGCRSFVTDRNLANAAYALSSKETAVGQRFLVAEDTPLTAAEFVAVLRRARGAAARLFAAPDALVAMMRRAPRLGAMVDRLERDLVMNCGGLRALGVAPMETGEAGLARMAFPER